MLNIIWVVTVIAFFIPSMQALGVHALLLVQSHRHLLEHSESIVCQLCVGRNRNKGATLDDDFHVSFLTSTFFVLPVYYISKVFMTRLKSFLELISAESTLR